MVVLGVEPPLNPPPGLRYRRRVDLRTEVQDLWRERRLMRTIAERDIRTRYAQLYLGIGWSMVLPLITVVVFNLFFRRIAHINTSGSPYPLFAYVGLLAWNFFSSGLSSGGNSLLRNSSILNKLYCPREVFPFAAILVNVFDMMLSTLALLVLFVAYGTAPADTIVWLPVVIGVELMFVLGAAMAFAVAIVYIRDLGQVLSGVLQAGLFLTPVAYGMRSIHGRHLQLAFSVLNPMSAIIDSCRRVVLWGTRPDWYLLGPAALTSLAVLVTGYLLFRRLEGGIADVL